MNPIGPLQIKWICPTAPTRPVAVFGGFPSTACNMGAATALYSATCCAHGKYGNGKPYPVNLSVVVGLSGWLPCARLGHYTVPGEMDDVCKFLTTMLGLDGSHS
ncbi:hypothetical protein B296_00050807 [Ensete ventricosum]|uniref:Uncharacterized protein n=1 Tax=Ensete ventricosum TaxID=4639 RepID=A0A426XFU2_ENSVE|nr:hypothetical protein B296_00050807 [Ensete ventricosum]